MSFFEEAVPNRYFLLNDLACQSLQVPLASHFFRSLLRYQTSRLRFAATKTHAMVGATK